MLEKKRKLCFVFTNEMDEAIIDYCYKHLLPVSKVFQRAWLTNACYYKCKQNGRIGIGAVKSLKKIGIKINENELTRAWLLNH